MIRKAFVLALALPMLLAASAQAADISPLTPAMRAAMTGKSWRPGCPVPLDDLAAVGVTYLGFDGHDHQGTLVVHKRFADDIAQIFAELHDAHFPIRKIAPWEDYGSGVYAEQDITTGFYCEKADDAPTQWSSHAYGMAVDINPLENPFYDLDHKWWPKGAAQYVPRDGGTGKISTQSDVFRIFARHGWLWGGFDPGVPDYMHFQKLTTGGGTDPMARPYTVTGLQYVPGGALEAAQPK